MLSSIRNLIIDLFKEMGKPVELKEIALQKNISINELTMELENTPLLKNYLGLTPEQIALLIEFYGEGLLFEKELEENVKKYFEARDRIQEIEASRKKRT